MFATFLEPEESHDAGVVQSSHDLDLLENVGALFSGEKQERGNEWS